MIPITRPSLGNKEVEAARKVILSGWVTQGPKVREFETAFAKFVGAKFACAVSNCTTALHLALLAIGVKPKDTVITVSHSFIATANSIRYCGAEPAFVDIDPETFNIDPRRLEEFLHKQCQKKNGILFHQGSRVAAILVVHQIGLPCDLRKILPLAKKFRLPVIEDAACATGSEIKFSKRWDKIGKPHGDIACFSFHPRKVLTTGEGGMITTANWKYDQKVRLLRHHGMNVSDLKRHNAKKIIFENYDEVGYNYRLSDIHAAVGIEQLKRVPGFVARRRQLAKYYQRELRKISWLKGPQEPAYAKSNWQSFAVHVLSTAPLKRNQLMQYLLENGVTTRPGIMNIHAESPYRSNSFYLKQSESARDNVILFPMYNDLTFKEIDKIISVLRKIK